MINGHENLSIKQNNSYVICQIVVHTPGNFTLDLHALNLDLPYLNLDFITVLIVPRPNLLCALPLTYSALDKHRMITK